MKTKPFVIAPQDYGRALDVAGTKVNVLVSNKETGGYEVTFQEGEEGTGPRLHSHGWDEAFFVLRGTAEFKYSEETVLCEPGTLVHLPAGTAHGYTFGPGGGAVLELAGDGSNATQMFTNMDREFPPGPRDIEKAKAVLAENGVTQEVNSAGER
ncbi:MAG: cupin domain-containing protein [Rhodospirillaceae bacterium]|jgi:quercetin dioxygenase-like cupin family protein|nr:cupin domain-containing protein [Rhodospirillaceae bacterium]MBT7486981.1 cupin domain-containing protein [Rhodospirillales bacterium]MBT4702225.1 cupin domain-containing protein [Rhodospirillaceae bacterium]MBT5035794.1 cupin domain-containing protein [Rhodospirillaceae bacterium]MBT6218797.1 cupin domain-containing protein [Rhodospirillaceae bacterium]